MGLEFVWSQDFLGRHKEFPTLGCSRKGLSEGGETEEGHLCQHWLLFQQGHRPPPRWARGPGAHRSVWLDEAVLQFLGIFPLPCEAESLQLAHLSPQDIGQGTHAPHSSCHRVKGRISAWGSSRREFQILQHLFVLRVRLRIFRPPVSHIWDTVCEFTEYRFPERPLPAYSK